LAKQFSPHVQKWFIAQYSETTDMEMLKKTLKNFTRTAQLNEITDFTYTAS